MRRLLSKLSEFGMTSVRQALPIGGVAAWGWHPFTGLAVYWTEALLLAIVALPLVVRSLLPVLRAIDPRQLQAAATLGASPARAFTTIELPYVVRGLGLAIGFALAVSLGEFGATSFLARPDRPTLPVVIFMLIGRPGAENVGMAMAASVVLAVLTAGVMAVAEWIGPREVTWW